MQTLIKVVNGVVTVTNESNPAINKQYKSYSEIQLLSVNDVTISLVGCSYLSTSNPEDIKAAYKKAGDILGVSVAQYVRQLKGAGKRAYIDPVNHLVKRFCLKRVWVGNSMKWTRSPSRVDAINRHASILQEYIDDGNEHIVAYGMLFGNTQDTKALLGKGLWKKICRTSKTRNDKIWAALSGCINPNDNSTSIKTKLIHFINTPTTLLTKLKKDSLVWSCMVATRWGIEDLLPKLMKYIGGPMCKAVSDDFYSLLNTINDTAGMRDIFDPKWSIKRMIDEHAAGVRDQIAKTYSKDLYNSAKFLTPLYEYEGCTAELLTSSYEVGLHGKEQHHCVGSYANLCSFGKYVVYKLTDTCGTVSTLGIEHPSSLHNATQHHLAYNQRVTNKDVLVLAERVKTDTLAVMKNHPEFVTDTLTCTIEQLTELHPNMAIPF